MKFHEDDEVVHTSWEEYEEEESHFQKHRNKYITLMSLILLTIAISSFFPQLTARFFSTQLSGEFVNETFYFNSEIEIKLSEKLHQELIDLYDKNQPLEMKSCLRGEITQNNGKKIYEVNEIYVPFIFSQSYSHVSFVPCDIDTIIDIHSQPRKNCLLSNTDFNTFNQIREQNEDIIMGVMCSHNEFIFVI